MAPVSERGVAGSVFFFSVDDFPVWRVERVSLEIKVEMETGLGIEPRYYGS